MKNIGGKLGTREKIIQFITKGDIVLSADEERMLDRWTFIDSLIRSMKYTRTEMVTMVQNKFTVSAFTVERDIRDTHFVFGSTRLLNKKYLLAHHLEEIALSIQAAKKDPVLKPMLPKLLDAYTKALLAIPDEIVGGDSTPTVLQYILKGQPIDTGMSPDQALEMARKYMKRQQDAEDIPYEKVEQDDWGE